MPTFSNAPRTAHHCPHCLGSGFIEEVVVATGEIKATRPCRGYAHMAWQPRLRKAPVKQPARAPSHREFTEALVALLSLAGYGEQQV